jgi:hypothetical protein
VIRTETPLKLLPYFPRPALASPLLVFLKLSHYQSSDGIRALPGHAYLHSVGFAIVTVPGKRLNFLNPI